ncbi:MAG: cadherin-like domain-containing protein, partial [Pseudomonadota bacterium]|nr:cadherin-like domain-containing protein [Pseudomonadota bacterium]
GVVGTPTELTYGTLTLNTNGSYVYTLKSGVTLGTEDQLSEVVTYTVSDGKGGTDTATLTIVISDYGIGDKTINVVEDGAPASGNLLADEDSGLEVVFVGPVDDLGDPGNAGVPFATTYGGITINANGSYVYTLNNALYEIQSLAEDDTLQDEVEFTVKNASGTFATATITINIDGTNDAPVARNDSASIVKTGSTVGGDVFLNDTDVDNDDVMTVTLVGGSGANVGSSLALAYGTINLNAAGTYTYTLNTSHASVAALAAGQSLQDTVTYQVTDTEGATSSATLTITINGLQPIVPADADYSVLEGGNAAMTQDQFARTATGSNYTITTLPQHGRLLLDNVEVTATGVTFTSADIASGKLRYEHDGTENFDDAFTYTVDSTPGQVFDITIMPVNEAPVIAIPDGTTPVTIAVNEHDATGTANGGGQDLTGLENAFLLTTTQLSGTDPDNQPATDLIYEVTAAPPGGNIKLWNGTSWVNASRFSVQDVADGKVAYFHNPGSEPDAATHQFSVRLTDGSELVSATRTIGITVTNSNDAPSASGGSLNLLEGGLVDVWTALNGKFDDSDADDTPDNLLLVFHTAPAHGTLLKDGVAMVAGVTTFTRADLVAGLIKYQHDGTENFTDSFKYFARDDEGLESSAATVSLSMFPVNDDPIIPAAGEDPGLPAGVETGEIIAGAEEVHGVQLSDNAYEGETVTITAAMLRAYDPDNTNTQVQFRITSNVTKGSIQVDGRTLGVGSVFTLKDVTDGKLKYVHKGDEVTTAMTDHFTFKVSDSSGGDEPDGYVPIYLNPVNDAPTLTAPQAVNVFEEATVNIAGFTVGDVDSLASDNLTVTLAVSANGTIRLGHGSYSNDVLNVVSGNGTTSITIEGTLSEINTILSQGVNYTGVLNYVGSDTLTITVNDNGHSGADPDAIGATGTTNLTNSQAAYQSVTKTVAITVLPVNDAPEIGGTPPASLTVDEVDRVV